MYVSSLEFAPMWSLPKYWGYNLNTLQGFFLGVLAKTQFVQNAKTQFENTKTQFEN